ncbi:YdhK family protein [Flexivirga alba]|uniref:YdhK family protein n=1 Tax=Flexivirga alba TaxID=702742 RepID=A0ABW2AII5_9MICO
MFPTRRARVLLSLAAAASLTVVAGCSSNSSSPAASGGHHAPSTAMDGMSMGSSSMPTSASSMAMDHGDGGPVPAGMKPASDPKYPVGSKVILTADHMEGMDGARASVVGAYSTFTYAVNYTPTTGGSMVKDHKWVVQQELQDAGRKRLANGTKVVLTTDHMSGMKGAHGTIASSTDQTVYVVDYTAGGMTMKNHKWVVEDEMKPAK